MKASPSITVITLTVSRAIDEVGAYVVDGVPDTRLPISYSVSCWDRRGFELCMFVGGDTDIEDAQTLLSNAATKDIRPNDSLWKEGEVGAWAAIPQYPDTPSPDRSPVPVADAFYGRQQGEIPVLVFVPEEELLSAEETH